jgi:hypothetical protein
MSERESETEAEEAETEAGREAEKETQPESEGETETATEPEAKPAAEPRPETKPEPRRPLLAAVLVIAALVIVLAVAGLRSGYFRPPAERPREGNVLMHSPLRINGVVQAVRKDVVVVQLQVGDVIEGIAELGCLSKPAYASICFDRTTRAKVIAIGARRELELLEGTLGVRSGERAQRSKRRGALTVLVPGGRVSVAAHALFVVERTASGGEVRVIEGEVEARADGRPPEKLGPLDAYVFPAGTRGRADPGRVHDADLARVFFGTPPEDVASPLDRAARGLPPLDAVDAGAAADAGVSTDGG